MRTTESIGFFTTIRKTIWTIESHEYKRFFLMAALMWCILFNYTTLRGIKDGFVVTMIGPQALSFLKTWFVFPCSIIFMFLYVKLRGALQQHTIFYGIVSFFIAYFLLFTFVFYPYPQWAHPKPEVITALCEKYSHFQWFIKIIGQWGVASFYVMSELWGSVVLSLLFWQLANQTTNTQEAKRFYPLFALLANTTGLVIEPVTNLFLREENPIVSSNLKFTPILLIIIASSVMAMLLYKWISTHFAEAPPLPNTGGGTKKKKPHLSFIESLKMILSSKYIGLVALLVIGYGISINLVEGVWKDRIRDLYPTSASYTMYMTKISKWTSICTMFSTVFASIVLRRLSWLSAALVTPVMILITGVIFFSFILFGKTATQYNIGIFTFTPLAVAVMMGALQNILSKSIKYTFFDGTKNMAYIPLDKELSAKGQAAVEVIGGRFGKSGGGVVQFLFFSLFPTLSFIEATPYFGGLFCVIVLAWIYAVKALNKEYCKALAQQGFTA